MSDGCSPKESSGVASSDAATSNDQIKEVVAIRAKVSTKMSELRAEIENWEEKNIAK